MPFFQGLGFDIPERKGIPDFLQEVSGLRDQEVCSPRPAEVSRLPGCIRLRCMPGTAGGEG